MVESNEASELIFKEEDHSYWLGSRRLLNITTILKLAGLVDDTWFTEEARIRGQAVHRAVLYSIQGDLDKKSLHPIVAPFYEAWEKFVSDFEFQPIKELCEKPGYHPQLFYAGTPDAPGYSKGRPFLIEIKTGDASTASYQTAAQNELPQLKKLFMQRFSLKLNSDASYKLTRYSDPNDWEIFKSAFNMASLIHQKRGDKIWEQ